MKVNIQTQRFEADAKLISFIEKKADKISQFHDRIVRVDIFLRLDNVVHQIKDKVVEIQVFIPGHHFFVKHSSKSFEGSFEIALDSVVNQMNRWKQKETV